MLEAIDLARPPMLAPTSLTLHPGQLTGVIGPNGAGKTTLLKALAGLSRGPGTVRLDGQPFLPHPQRLAWLPASRDAVWPIPAAALVQLGLGPAAAPDPAAVSAAVLLARAIVARPAWLLLDEPIANLDPGHRLDVMELLASETARDAGVVLALHDLDLARRCDRLLLIANGAVIADGPPHMVLNTDQLGRVFGVQHGPDGWVRCSRFDH